MASPLTVFASSYAADGALTAWTKPGNAYADDTSYASIVGMTLSTWYGNLYGFDLSGIPDGATITSITITALYRHTNIVGYTGYFLLGAKSGGSEVGSATDDTNDNSLEVWTYQPTGLDAAALKATGANGFWAIARCKEEKTSGIGSLVFYLDYVTCTVEYTEGGTPDELTAAALFSRRPRKKDDDEVLAMYALLENEW